MERDEEFYNAVADERISARQVDELIGLARGLVADGQLNDAEVRFLHTWLAANAGVSGHHKRVHGYLELNKWVPADA